jgi:hypothetical protein
MTLCLERVVSDAGYADGDCDTGYAAAIKRVIPNGCDRQTVYRAWDGHNGVGTSVTGYSDHLVSDRVTELGLHSNRSGQEQPAKKEQQLSFHTFFSFLFQIVLASVFRFYLPVRRGGMFWAKIF